MRLLAICCSGLHVINTLRVLNNIKYCECTILVTKRFHNDVRLAKCLEYECHINTIYIDDYNEVFDSLLQGYDKLLVFTIGDSWTVRATNRFHGETVLGEDGSFPYYRSYDSYDNYDVKLRANYNSFKSIVKRKLLRDRLVNFSKTIDALAVSDDHLFSFPPKKKLIILKDSTIPVQFLSKVLAEFKVKDITKVKSDGLIFFDSSILGEFEMCQERLMDYIFEILESLPFEEVIFKMSPLRNLAREEIILKKIKNSSKIHLDDNGFDVPFEILYQRFRDYYKTLTFASQRCSTFLTPYMICKDKINVLSINDKILSDFPFEKHTISDHMMFNSYLELLDDRGLVKYDRFH